jgi:hypothetical protein
MTDRTLLLLDSIGHVRADAAGKVIVSGSHGGRSAAEYILVLPAMPHAALFNDAAVGKEDAGIVGLAMLAQRGVAAAAYSHLSARIGDAADGLACGVITHLNPLARAAGLSVGMRVADAVRRLGADPGAPTG